MRRQSYYGSRRSNGLLVPVLIAVAVVLVLGLGSCGAAYYKDSSVTVKVTGKESVNTDSGHEYRIYSDDEVYVMEDSLIKGRFRTANDYARLKQGKTYQCKAFGWRVPLLSSFKNLHDCQEVAR